MDQVGVWELAAGVDPPYRPGLRSLQCGHCLQVTHLTTQPQQPERFWNCNITLVHFADEIKGALLCFSVFPYYHHII